MEKMIETAADQTTTDAPFWTAFVERIEPDFQVEALGLRTLISEFDIVTDADYLIED